MIPTHKHPALSETSFASQENGALPIRRGRAQIVREDAIHAIRRWLSAFYLPSEASQKNEKHQPNEPDEIRLHGMGVRW